MADDGEAEPIVEFSVKQRWPSAGEPVCAICGRYGEYIADATGEDVCSLQCKFQSISRNNLQPRPSARSSGVENVNSEASSDSTCPGKFLTAQQIQAVRSELQLNVLGTNIPPPFVEFSDAGGSFPERLMENAREDGITSPTPVQMQALPLVLNGRHILAAAPPGSGKTAAFLLPLLARITNDCRESGAPRVLILAGTRELAQQLEEQTKRFARGLPNIHTALVVGGLPTKPQVYRLRTAAQVVIATPGKLFDLLKEHITDEDFFSELLAVVLDEADRVMHKEFDDQVLPILESLPHGVQKLMFSATTNDRLKRIAADLLTDHVTLTVGQANMPSASVRQTIIWVEEAAKKTHLFAILNNAKHYTPPVLVFVDRQHGADLLADAIVKKCNLTACSIHAGLDQATRSKLVAQFRHGEFPILVSTPLLGRGIDWPQVQLVVNFDMPTKIAEFVHQTGRAGRMGSRGRAITLINGQSSRIFGDLKALLSQSTQLPRPIMNTTIPTSTTIAAPSSVLPHVPSASVATSSDNMRATFSPLLPPKGEKIKRKNDVTAQSLLDVLKGVHGAKKKR